MRLWSGHRTAMQQRAGAKRDLHMHAWLESVQSGQMSPAGRSASPVARYRLVKAWPSKVAAGLARAGAGMTVAVETNHLAVERNARGRGEAPLPAKHRGAGARMDEGCRGEGGFGKVSDVGEGVLTKT